MSLTFCFACAEPVLFKTEFFCKNFANFPRIPRGFRRGVTEVRALTAEFGGGKHAHVACEGNIHAGARGTAEFDATYRREKNAEFCKIFRKFSANSARNSGFAFLVVKENQRFLTGKIKMVLLFTKHF